VSRPRVRTRARSDPRWSRDVDRVVRQLQVQEAARNRISAERDRQALELPRAGETLAHELAAPERPVRYTVEQLHPQGANSLLVAQYKTGKTTLLLNLVQALADEEPFLGHFPVRRPRGRLAYLNYELDPEMFRRWVRAIGIKHPERIARPLHLRGQTFPFWLPSFSDTVVRWLRANKVKFLILDPAAEAWRGMVDNENDNGQVGAFTHALDELKRRARVEDLILATHMGRQLFDENSERSRGATRLEDWMDAGWYLRKEGRAGERSLRADGRDVSVEAIDLLFDSRRRRLRFTGQTRRERRVDAGLMNVVDALAELERRGRYPPKTGDLEESIHGDKSQRHTWIRLAVDRGLVSRKRGPHGAQLHELTDAGRTLIERRVHRGGR
jgi:hypothetical protein